MKTLWLAAAASMLGFATAAVHAKGVCDIHHLGYTKAQCDQCTNMTWSVSRVFPQGTCVSNAAPQPVTVGKTPVPVAAKKMCDIHHLGYTQAQCNDCSNMTWSVSKVFPRGECVGTTAPAPIAVGGKGTTPTPVSAGASCTLTNWGGATIPLASPNFSGTGVRVSVCSKGYDLAKSKLHCSTGTPTQAFNYPTTNVTCNKTTGAPVFNPQVTINGQPCCLN